MRRHYEKASWAALAAAGAVVLAGCSGTDPNERKEPAAPSVTEAAQVAEATGTPRAAEVPAPAPAPAATPAATPAESGPPSAAPAEDLHPSELFRRIGLELPTAPMGRPDLGQSLVADQLAKNPELRPEDPEADSVLRGRRLVGPVDRELAGAFDSPEELVEAYLDALFYQDRPMLHEMRVSQAEHEDIFWPEFPESRPITNVAAEEAWTYHNRHCLGGVNEVLNRVGGRRLWLQEIRYTEGIARYRNFNLYRGVQIVAADERGGPLVVIDEAPTLAERNGEWKFYIYKD